MKMLFLAAAVCAAVLTGCKEAKSKQSTMVIQSYSDNWKLVEVRPPDSQEMWLFRKNLGVSEIKGHKDLPTLVYFTVQYTPRDASGLPNEDDTRALYDFEEQVIPDVEKNAGCVLVASVVKGGVKDHLFYVSDPDAFIATLNQHRSALDGFGVSLEKHEDPTWEIYDDFPGDE